MVYQGTVLGPWLWNLFYEDARDAITENGFEDVVVADDLNAYRTVPNSLETDICLEMADECQQSLHQWGEADRAVFDAGKESAHILSRTHAHGDKFKPGGVVLMSS